MKKLIVVCALAATALIAPGRADATLSSCYAAPINGYRQVTAACGTYNTYPSAEPNQYRAYGFCPSVGYMYGPWKSVPYSSTTGTCPFQQFTSWGYQTG